MRGEDKGLMFKAAFNSSVDHRDYRGTVFNVMPEEAPIFILTPTLRAVLEGAGIFALHDEDRVVLMKQSDIDWLRKMHEDYLRLKAERP